MVTEGMVFAIDDMINICKNKKYVYAMTCLREMLCAFDDVEYGSMGEDERKDWLSNCMP